MTIPRMLRFLVLLTFLSLVGCGGAAKPQVNVIGMTRGESLLVEIHNPTDHALSLTEFDWTLVAEGRKLASGTLSLERAILPGGATVVEIPVQMRPSGAYRLDGRLRDREHATWRVSVNGRFH